MLQIGDTLIITSLVCGRYEATITKIKGDFVVFKSLKLPVEKRRYPLFKAMSMIDIRCKEG